MEDLKLRKKNLIMFPLGTVGRDMEYYLFTSCIMTFVLFTRNLTSAQFAAITAIVVAARIFDALNDPIMGNIIERTRTRWGKFKPWLVIGILSTSVVVYLAFNTSLQGWSFVWFFGVIYFMYSITYTMHDISYWGMVPALSSDANARNQFTARATLFAGIGGTLASVLIPMLTVGDKAIGGSTTTAYGVIALVICIIAPLFLCFTIFGVREKREYTDAPPVSLKKIWKTITGNDQLLWISLIFLIQQIGNGFIIGGIGSTYIYFDFGYNGGLFSLFSIVGMSVTAFLMIFYPAISRKIKRKKLMGILAVIAVAGYVIMLIAGLVLPSTMLKFWAVVIGYMLSNFGQYGFYLVMMISIINTVEYNEYVSGQRDEAIIASLRPFLTKLSSALIILITNLSYIIFGVTSYTNQISDFENQCARNFITEADKISLIDGVINGIAPGQTLALLLCMAIIPCVLMLTSYVLYKKHYKLDEDEYTRICAELEARKAKA
ncbi:MAG: glycoside-pentoside-hexuronide (GPH):cation symporter [Oscillospiraceae bacterium]|nr:glycoside-pentoside-hexuronide (GPH):cation symporter [Oscillospiraceae bacterium]